MELLIHEQVTHAYSGRSNRLPVIDPTRSWPEYILRHELENNLESSALE